MKKQRIEWVDIFKGILIFLMVIGHSSNLKLIPWVYAFHMAGFFFISGYTTNYDKYDFITYVKKKTKNLLFPFVTINVLFFFLQFFLNIIGLYNIYYSDTFSLYSIVNFVKYWITFDLAGASWFLIVLFMVSLLSKLIYDIIKSYKLKNSRLIHLIISFVLFIMFYILFYKNGERSAYLLDLVPISLFFLSLGFYVSNKPKLLSNKYCVVLKIFFCCFYTINMIFFNQGTDWAGRVFPALHVLLINSIGGIILLIEISKIIVLLSSKIKIIYNVFNYMGKNTIEILKYHFLGFRIIFSLLFIVGYLDVTKLRCLVPPYYGFVETFITAVISVILSLLIALIEKQIWQGVKKIIRKIIESLPEKIKNIDYLLE